MLGITLAAETLGWGFDDLVYRHLAAGDHGTYIESKGLNKAFVQRGLVYFVTESTSAGESMKTLATVLDDRIKAGLPSQRPESE